jgi:hypothetical protein
MVRGAGLPDQVRSPARAEELEALAKFPAFPDDFDPADERAWKRRHGAAEIQEAFVPVGSTKKREPSGARSRGSWMKQPGVHPIIDHDLVRIALKEGSIEMV